MPYTLTSRDKFARRLNNVMAAVIALACLLTAGPASASYTCSLAGSTASFTGNSSNDNLQITISGGLLKHNRATAGDPGFNSDFDFNSAAGGDQTLAPSALAAIIVNGGAGTSDVLTFDDSTNTDPTNITITGNSLILPSRLTLTFSNVESLEFFGGTGTGNDNVQSTTSGVAYNIFEYDSDVRQVHIGNGSNTMDDIQGTIYVGTSGVTTYLNDAGKNTPQTYNLAVPLFDTHGHVTRAGMADIEYAGGLLDMSLGSNNDTVYAARTKANVHVHGNNGNDLLVVGDAAEIQTFEYEIAFSGDEGDDILILNNAAATKAESYVYRFRAFMNGVYKFASVTDVEDAYLLTGTSTDSVYVYVGDYSDPTLHVNTTDDYGQSDMLQLVYTNANQTGTVDGTNAAFSNGVGNHPGFQYYVDNVDVQLLDGSDSVSVAASVNTNISVHGGPNTSGLDTVTLTSGGSAYTLTSDTFQVAGKKPVHFDGFEVINKEAQAHGPDLIGYLGLPVLKCKTTACSLKATLLEINTGDQPSAITNTRFYLSDDNVLDGNDTEIAVRTVKALGAGGYRAVKLSAKLPAGANPVGSYLIAKIDADDQSAERFESNNTVVSEPLTQ